jgi:hypothetical protein
LARRLLFSLTHRGATMMKTVRRFAWLSLLMVGCMPVGIQGGSNGNDRSAGGDQGEVLLTGAMVVSADGHYIAAQRNQTSVLVDLSTRAGKELPDQFERFIFANHAGRGYAILADHATVVAYDLARAAELWRVRPSFESSAGATLAKLSDDDTRLVLGDQTRLLVFDTSNGKQRDPIAIGSQPTEFTWLAGTRQALVLGATHWTNHLPETPLLHVDVETGVTESTIVANCAAPIVVMPDAKRAFVSPTFCEEGGTNSGSTQWTNPDPVSIIDLTQAGPNFVKNLPGFGPAALDPGGNHLFAYLDTQRMDAAMFDDPTQVPALTGPRYHILVIDPTALSYELVPVGDELPRFALARDGHDLLVDATVRQIRGEAKFELTIDTSGHFSADVHVFGSIGSPLGVFDVDTGEYRPLAGTTASLDRFVQLGNATQIYTLRSSADGMGGDLFRIDLSARTVTDLGKSLRDIGLLADQSTLVLRERLPAAKVQASVGFDWYRRERFCLSSDGIACELSIDFQDSVPFQSGSTCADYHDC